MVTRRVASAATSASPVLRGVLRSRLLAPRIPADCLRREALVDCLLEALSGRLVAVLAGAGYGKTTLLVQALTQTPLPSVWCSCDARLTDSRLLLAHLAVALAERFPGFGAELGLRGSVEAQVAELCNEIVATLPDDVVVVLDDVHSLSGSAAEALGLLAQDLAPTVHLALAGRSPLPFALGRLRAGGIVEIGEQELALTEQETETLLRSMGLRLPSDALADLYRRTEGWLAGLILAAKSGGRLASEGRLAQPQFDYLAEEVIHRQPARLQRFLMDTAILGRFTPSLAAAVSEEPGAAEICHQLVSAHLFTVPLDAEGEWYRYHHLFQSVLARRLQEHEPGRIAVLHARAASWLEAAGETVEAVRHYLDAGDPQAALEALEPAAEAMLGTAEAETLAALLDRIPQSLWEGRPRLILSQATLLLTRAHQEAAFTSFDWALERLLALEDHERAAEVLFRLFQTLITAGTAPARRIELAAHYIERIDDAARMLPVARLLLAASYGYGWRFDDACSELSRALSLPAAAGSPLIRIYAELIRAIYIGYPLGCGTDTIAATDAALSELERHQAEDTLALLPIGYILRGLQMNEVGRFEDALEDVRRTEQAAASRGIRRAPRRALDWVRSVAMAGLERWDELEQELAPPTQAPGTVEATSYTYRLGIVSARLAAHRGDVEAVRSRITLVREQMAAYGQVMDDPIHLCDLALAAFEAGLSALARELAEAARTDAARAGPWWRARAALVSGLVHGPGRGDGFLADALSLSLRWDLTPLWSLRQRRVAADLLARAITDGIGPPGAAARLAVACGGEVLTSVASRVRAADVRALVELADAAIEAPDIDPRLVRQLLRDADPAVRKVAGRAKRRIEAQPRPPLRLVSLGRLAVFRGETRLSDDLFGRQMARKLLAVLLSAEGPIHRDVLLERLWPHLPPDRARVSLHSTLYSLRRAIDPGLSPGGHSQIITDGETYGLNLGPADDWDAARFERLAHRGLEASSAHQRIDVLRSAEACYTGPFLPEWAYEDWASARRLKLERSYCAVVEALADAFSSVGQADLAVARYERLLELDPEREAWHRALMQAYARAGERPRALRQYHACRTLLRERLAVDPSPETRALYRALL